VEAQNGRFVGGKILMDHYGSWYNTNREVERRLYQVGMIGK